MCVKCSSWFRRVFCLVACKRADNALNELSQVEEDLAWALERREVIDLRDRLLCAEERVAAVMRARSERAWDRAMIAAGEAIGADL